MKMNKGVKKKRTRTEESSVESVLNNTFRSFKELLPVIQSPQGMKPAVLKKLHGLLVILSSEAKWTADKCEIGSHNIELEMCHNGIQVKYRDICELSNIIFREVGERVEQCLLTMCDISDNKDLGGFSSCSVLYETVEVVSLLLRCCMVLILLTAPILIRDTGTILMRILGKLNLLNSADKNGKCDFVFEKSACHESHIADNDFNTSFAEKFTDSLHVLEPYNQLLYFKSTVLEVYVDELLMNNKLRGCLQKIDSAASINDRQFFPQSTQGDFGSVVELICHQFILRFSDKQLFGDFLTRLFRLHEKELTYLIKAPALQVTAARSLLSSPVMVAAPKYVIAHMVTLVSEAMDSVTKSSKPDHKLINCFLLTFEQSITLYTKHMSCFQTNTYPSHAKTPSFDSYISADMKNKIHSLISELDQSSNTSLHDSFSEMKSDLVSSSMSFVKECQHIYDTSCQDEIMNILSCLVLKASESFDEAAIRPIECTSLQHIFLQASLLKLISISLLQIIWCLRHGDDLCCLKTLKDFSSCKEYDFVLGIIACFKDLNLSLPLQQVLSKAMSSYSTRHTDSKMMFLHFAGLMSLSFACGLDCLVKGCLLGIIALLNLFVFEGGNLDALLSIVTSHSDSFSASSAVVIFQKAVVGNNSALVVASKFRNMRSRHLRLMDNKCEEMKMSEMEPTVAMETETNETCNGELYFKCVLKDKKVNDCEDLLDFVECTKEFPTWLGIRQTYCRKKLELSWKRKKKSWKPLKGKRKSNFRNA